MVLLCNQTGDEIGEYSKGKSTSNIYHVVLRGMNRQQIFLDDEAGRISDKAAHLIIREIAGSRDR